MQYLMGFGPWIILWTQGSRHFRLAALAALAVCLALNVKRFAMRRVKVLEAGSLIFFVVVATLGFTDAASWLQLYATPLSNAALGTIAFVSILIGAPFCTQYGREKEPERLWNHPLFLRTTLRLSWIWVVTFLSMACCQFASPVWPEFSVLLRWELPYFLLATAAAISIWYPKHVRRVNDEMMARAHTPGGR